jgi:hypothetical protein
MTHMGLGPNVILIATPDLVVRQVAGFFEFGNYPLGGTFGYADAGCDLAQADPGSSRDQTQSAGVIREEGPSSWALTAQGSLSSWFDLTAIA